ncbi:MAG: [protein-PII] uridylyltransferase [Deltaproteobacteria bacterium]|nr:[protein-PII] uridylyltransferase [Deltaproteobacteria bacterium]
MSAYDFQLASALTSNPAPATAIKDFLARAFSRLRERHQAGSSGLDVCAAYAGAIDAVLCTLYSVMSQSAGAATDRSQPIALAALGGYGRSELNFRSDIDLMLVHAGKLTPRLEKLTQDMLYVLWDTGLDMAFSIRSVEECIALSKEDLKTKTSLLDSRLLMGDETLFNELNVAVREKLFSEKGIEAFIKDKAEETAQRHARYGESVYILEPNIKEGEGGLRDFHAALWAVKAKHGGNANAVKGLISDKDEALLRESFDFLLWVRNELHLGSSRKTDQLTFDHQERIAAILGFKQTEAALAVESFMHRYYKSASNISHYSCLVFSRCAAREEKKGFFNFRKKTLIDDVFEISEGALKIADKEAFSGSTDASIVFKAFARAQERGVAIDQSAVDVMMEYASKSGERLRSSRAADRLFLDLLKNAGAYKTLSEMHRLRILERYIPEFAEVSCRVQHDLYHVYTVDAHTLFAIREIERLKGEYKSQFHLLATIFEELKKPELLLLAVLFHDIGKGRGKGHAQRGADMTEGICARMGLTDEDSGIVRLLVREHLILADLAQYRDIHDEKLVMEFAQKVGDVERLNMLYLLTFADVRAVGPEVWSQWKGALFQELYFKALTVLERGTFEPEDVEARVGAIRKGVVDRLSLMGLSDAIVDDYFDLLPKRYFLTTSPAFIAAHIELYGGFGAASFILKVRQDEARAYTELIILTHDTHGLFSMITGVIAANGGDILGAQINTMKNGVALDVLQVVSRSGELITDAGKLKKIESDLYDVITGRVKVAVLAGKRHVSILDKKAKPRVPTRIEIDNEVSDAYTVIDIHTQNRIGLLYDITSAASLIGLYIYIAKINTKGDEAADIFYVKDIFGQKIYYKEKLKEIVDSLFKAITENS